MRNSPNDRNRIQADREESSLFGFELSGLDWLERVLDFVEPDSLDSIGSYEGVEEVSRGGQGIIYRARQPGTGRQVALKRMLAGSSSSGAARARLQREAEAAASLSHPGIVTVYGLEEVDGLPVYAMEWIEGEPITAWARGEGRTLEEILRAFLQVCDAVRHAHQRGVLHRDLKPSNVLVDREGRPRVLDFGLAKRVTENAADATRTQGFVGTPAYAAPEQIEGKNELVDARSDVYSLGVVLYEMLTGERPYRPEEGMLAFAAALEDERFARPSSLRPGIAREIDSIVATAIAAHPDERYQSVDALAADVGRFLAHQPVEAHAGGSWYALAKIARRHRAVFALSALLALTALGSALFFAVQAQRLAEKRDEAFAARREADSLALREREAREEAERTGEELALQVEAADLARTAAESERARAEDEGARAEAILVFMLDRVLGAASSGEANMTIREAIDRAGASVGLLYESDPVVEGFIRIALGRLYAAMNDTTRARAEFTRAIELLDASSRPIEAARAAAYLSSSTTLHGPEPERLRITDENVQQSLAALREREASLSVDDAREMQAILALRYQMIDELIALRGPDAARDAERLIEETQELGDRKFGRDGRIRISMILDSRRARVLDLLGRREEADAIRRRVVDDELGRSDEFASMTASLLEELMSSAVERSNFAEAEALSLDAEATWMRVHGANHIRIAMVRFSRSGMVMNMSRFDEGLALAEEAWEILRAAPDVSTGQLAFGQYHLGTAIFQNGDVTRAAEVLQEADLNFAKAYAADSPHLLLAKGHLGLALFHSGREEESVEPLLLAIEYMKDHPSPDRAAILDREFRCVFKVLARRADRDGVERAFEQRLVFATLAQDQARVHLDHARLLREVFSDVEEARALEEKARDLDPATADMWERDPPSLPIWELDPADILTRAFKAR